MLRGCSGLLIPLLIATGGSTAAGAELPVVLEPHVTLSVFDTGGALDFAANGGFTLGGLEVNPLAVEVFVLAGDSNIFTMTEWLQLIRSEGMDTSTTIGAAQPIALIPWAYDLTRGPDGRYYVAGALSGVGGVYGFDPAGETSVKAFASGTPTWATSGLSFDTTGAAVLVSTDGSSATSTNGLYQVTQDSVVSQLVRQAELPEGIPRGTEDHVVTLDGRVILAGDKSHDLWDVTGGAGSVNLLIGLDSLFDPGEVPGWGSDDNVWGSRATVDPVSGDVFYAHATAAPPDTPVSIVRVAPDGAAASVFATGFRVLRDLDFGPSSSGDGRSLYVAEFSGGSGTIYELTFAEPGIRGQPLYQAGVDAGVYLWKETYDGPYHVEVSGGGPLSVFSVELLADKPIAGITPRLLEANDTIVWSEYRIGLEARVTSGIDGLEFTLSPGAKALISVEKDGLADPRQLHIGASDQPLSPRGWIAATDTLPAPPSFIGGQDLGLFLGRDAASDQVRVRWNGDGSNHEAKVELMFSALPDAVVPVGLEPQDEFVVNENWVTVDSRVSTWWDGIDISLQPTTRVGLVYRQDGLWFSPMERVNPGSRNLGLPNAYGLPRAEPYGDPGYDAGTEAGLFVWKDPASGVWHVRGTGGSGFGRYIGEVVATQPFSSVTGVSLEGNDVLDTTDPLRIVFDMRMWSPWEDGFDFRVPAGAQVTLNLQSASGGNPVETIRIGAERWPIQQLPVDISGW